MGIGTFITEHGVLWMAWRWSSVQSFHVEYEDSIWIFVLVYSLLKVTFLLRLCFIICLRYQLRHCVLKKPKNYGGIKQKLWSWDYISADGSLINILKEPFAVVLVLFSSNSSMASFLVIVIIVHYVTFMVDILH